MTPTQAAPVAERVAVIEWRAYCRHINDLETSVYAATVFALNEAEAEARFNRDGGSLYTFLCCEPLSEAPTILSFAINAERVVLILGRQKAAETPGPRQPKPALPVEVWRDTSTQPDYMAAVRSLCGG